jgi:hypothetical protein
VEGSRLCLRGCIRISNGDIALLPCGCGNI